MPDAAMFWDRTDLNSSKSMEPELSLSKTENAS